ncbi:hypothetical protein M8J77_005034 [Diaphorina citri]|nr:hypothetical protein M8J77_005034 [Diaphorina citri]
MEVQANSKLIAYADDLVVVTWADTKTDLEREMKETIIQIENWMEDHKLKLALQKTEIVMLASKRRCKEISVEIGGMVVTSKMCAKYLGVYFDRDMRMKEHLKKAVEKAGKTANNLARVMPNIDGPDNGKRRMLASVVYSILLYGAPVWGNVTKWHKYVTLLERVQRKVMLRLCRAYRTTSTPALQIITGTLPIELMVKEKVELYTLNKINDEEEQKIREEELKENLWEIWMEKWENETTRGQWTKRIIKNVKEWVERKHGCVTYEMSQFLTGHGNFGTYLKRMRKVRTERCQYLPPDILDYPTSSDMIISEHTNVTLECAVRGSPTPVVTWKREDSTDIVLGSTKRAVVYEGTSLTFQRVSRRQAGAYLCIASNGVPPSVSKRISLIVHYGVGMFRQPLNQP